MGLKFSLYLLGKTKTDSLFIKKATEEEIKNDDITKVTNIVAKNGVVVAKGLDDGKYKIVEEKAPAGYSVVTVNDVTIENGGNPTATVNVSDTKLHSLPHTGGMGTYLFTIIGVVVMVGAAGAFFISRRKGSEE
ncbi:MAG: SpaA isopeptide-forming pilin-related protein [Ruminococcus sp.]